MAASAYFCGSSTHTSTSAYLTRRSISRWWSTSVESWSGRSSSTSPSSFWSVGGTVEHAEPRHLVTRRDAHPLQQPLGTFGTPRAGQRPRGGGASNADSGELEVGERVEQRRLARTGGSGQRDDGVLAGEPEASGGPFGRARRPAPASRRRCDLGRPRRPRPERRAAPRRRCGLRRRLVPLSGVPRRGGSHSCTGVSVQEVGVPSVFCPTRRVTQGVLGGAHRLR